MHLFKSALASCKELFVHTAQIQALLTELCEKNREQVNYILGERVHPTIFSQLQTYTQVSQREKPFLSMYTTPNTTQN